MTPTAEEVAQIVREVVADSVLGVYLHGSAAMGGLKATSDIDVLAVIGRVLSDDERKAMLGRMLEISGKRAHRGPGRPVELTVVVQSDVRPWHYPPMLEFQYGEWLRDDYEAGLVPFAETTPDLAPLITMVLAANHPLSGPPPAELLDPVPIDDVRRAMLAGISHLFADIETDTRNVVLTLARIWFTLATGEIRSKDAAAEWVLGPLPREHRPVLARARDMYRNGLDDDPSTWANLAPEVRAFAGHVVGEIARLVPE